MIKRKINYFDEKYMQEKYSHIVNPQNIHLISSYSINWVFYYEDKELKEIYLHNVLDEYIKANKHQGLTWLYKLKRVVKKVGITLTFLERHNLVLLEERIFSSKRHIKDINVNFRLDKKELVGIKFDNATLFRMENNVFTFKQKGDLLVSNKRILFQIGDKIIYFLFSKIKEYFLDDLGLHIKTGKNNEYFLIKIHDQKTLKNTFDNMIK